MGRSGAYRKAPGKHQGKGKKGKTKEKPQGTIIPKYAYFAKSKLAAYPDENGVPFYLPKGQDENKFLRLKSIFASCSGENEELCRRIGMGLALDAASTHNGAQLLRKRFGESLPEEMREKLRKTGIPMLVQALATEEGKAFEQSLSVLDVGKTRQPSEKSLKKAVQIFVEYLLNDGDGSLRRNLARLASDAAALYLFAMTLLKDMAFIHNAKDWAKKVEGKQRNEVRAWQKKPNDRARLLAALLAEIVAKARANDPAPGDGNKASADSSSPANATAASDSGASRPRTSSASRSVQPPPKRRSSASSSTQPPPKRRARSRGAKAAKSKRDINTKALVLSKEDEETE